MTFMVFQIMLVRVYISSFRMNKASERSVALLNRFTRITCAFKMKKKSKQ